MPPPTQLCECPRWIESRRKQSVRFRPVTDSWLSALCRPLPWLSKFLKAAVQRRLSLAPNLTTSKLGRATYPHRTQVISVLTHRQFALYCHATPRLGPTLPSALLRRSEHSGGESSWPTLRKLLTSPHQPCENRADAVARLPEDNRHPSRMATRLQRVWEGRFRSSASECRQAGSRSQPPSCILCPQTAGWASLLSSI